MTEHKLPADIERTSLSIITKELEALGIALEPENAPVVKRVIHTTADFDYAKNLYISSGALALGAAALAKGTHYYRYQHGKSRGEQAGPCQVRR